MLYRDNVSKLGMHECHVVLSVHYIHVFYKQKSSIYFNFNFVGLLHHPIGIHAILNYLVMSSMSKFCFFLLRITDTGSISLNAQNGHTLHSKSSLYPS